MNIIAPLKMVTVLGLICSLLACSGAREESPDTASSPQPAETGTLPRVGVQLWSVKEQLAEDYQGTIEAIAKMGFEGVELFTRDTLEFAESDAFGSFGNDPVGFKNYLAQHNLVVSSSHIHFKFLNPENFDSTVAFYQALGCDKLVVPMDSRAWDPDRVEEVVAELNQLAEKLAPHGMSIGYHNHAQEFAEFNNATFWDYIAQSTSEKVTLQLDVGWVQYTGKDPVAYTLRYPGRTVTTQYKIRTPEGVENFTPIIGQDDIDWPGLIDAAVSTGGTQWIVIEQEEYPNGMTPLEAVGASKAGLDKYLAEFAAR